jgi:hypothetical protein
MTSPSPPSIDLESLITPNDDAKRIIGFTVRGVLPGDVIVYHHALTNKVIITCRNLEVFEKTRDDKIFRDMIFHAAYFMCHSNATEIPPGSPPMTLYTAQGTPIQSTNTPKEKEKKTTKRVRTVTVEKV